MDENHLRDIEEALLMDEHSGIASDLPVTAHQVRELIAEVRRLRSLTFTPDPPLEQALCASIHQYYERYPTGGTLHIVLDDGNCERIHVQWCIDNSISEEHDVDALAIAQALLRIDTDRRFELYENGWVYDATQTSARV